MSSFYKDITIGAVFLTGILGFLSGEFIISSVLFASACVASNINANSKNAKRMQLSFE